MPSETGGRSDEARAEGEPGLPFDVRMEIVSMRGDAQEIMDREARGEPPPPDILDRILAWLPWGC